MKKYLIPNEENEYTPHLLRESGLLAVCLLIVVTLAVTAFQSVLLRPGGLLGTVYPALVADQANLDRQNFSLSNLTVNPLLQKAAELKAEDMVSKGYFAHVSPDGKKPWYWFSQAGYNFVYAGENLAINFTDSSAVNDAWMNSPDHRQNILNPHYTEIGVAVVNGFYNGAETTFVVEMFGSRAVPLATITATTSAPTASTTKTVIALAPSVKNSTASTSKVLGSEVVAVGSSQSTFVALDSRGQVVEQDSLSQKRLNSDASPASKPTFWLNKLISSPLSILVIVLGILAVLVIFTLLATVLLGKKDRHPKHLWLGFAALIFIVLVFLLYTYFFPTITVVG